MILLNLLELYFFILLKIHINESIHLFFIYYYFLIVYLRIIFQLFLIGRNKNFVALIPPILLLIIYIVILLQKNLLSLNSLYDIYTI